jgi:ribonuclease R
MGRPPPPRSRQRSHDSSRGSPHHRRPATQTNGKLQTGTVRLDADGNGHLIAERPGTAPVFLHARELTGIADGDTVTVSVEIGRKGRKRGRIVSKGLRLRDEVVGILHFRGHEWTLVPEPEGPPFQVDPPALGEAAAGCVVAAHVASVGRGSRLGHATITEVLGRPDDPKVQVEMLIRTLDLPLQFNNDAIDEASRAPRVDPTTTLAAEPSRRDLRHIPHVTIDGEDARDFDDAVAAAVEHSGIRVWVSIADVSHYVKPGSALDLAARERGTSVYFPHRAIPMLPPQLSSDLCSLVPHEPRLTLTCEMRVRSDGITEDVHVYPSLIESAARLTYTQVQRGLDLDGGTTVHSGLPDLVAAARALRARRAQRGAIDLDIPEAQVILGPDGVAAHVRQLTRLEAHRVIEDLMIAANEAVAELLLARGFDTLFRVHETPDPDRIVALAAWAATAGLFLDPAATTNPHTLARLADAIKGRPQSFVGMTLLLRSLAQARYSAENVGHYGLASRAYLHFTSPIRRYPDLLVHRALYSLWRGKRPREGALEESATRTSTQERRADDAERKVEQLMACHVAAQHVGEVFEAVVTGIHEAGAFVRVRDPWLDGLLPVATLGDATQDYYDVIVSEHALVGRRSGHRVALGDTLRVRLASVSTYRRHIDFVPAEITLQPSTRPGLHPRPPQARTHPAKGKAKSAATKKKRTGADRHVKLHSRKKRR